MHVSRVRRCDTAVSVSKYASGFNQSAAGAPGDATLARMPRRLWFLWLLAACARDNTLRDGGPDDLDFTIGDIEFHVASGTARVEGSALGLYLTDQPDACMAIRQVPTGSYTVFGLRVAAQLDGTRSAIVIPSQVVPAPGQASGALDALTSGVRTGGHAASDGAVTWKANADGTTTILSLDVGFDGTSDRLQAAMLTIPSCP